MSEALSPEQRQFAAEQHNLIYAYLKEKGLYHEEYYDIAAIGYLQAVKRYLTQPALRQYAFSTIAWSACDKASQPSTAPRSGGRLLSALLLSACRWPQMLGMNWSAASYYMTLPLLPAVSSTPLHDCDCKAIPSARLHLPRGFLLSALVNCSKNFIGSTWP